MITEIKKALAGIFTTEEAEKAKMAKIIPKGPFVVKTKNSVYRFGEDEGKGVRSVSRDDCPLPENKCQIKHIGIGKYMELNWYPETAEGWITTAVISIESI